MIQIPVDYTELLAQRRYWVTSTGAVRRRDMTRVHKANVLAFLLRHADNVAAAYFHRPEFVYLGDTSEYVTLGDLEALDAVYRDAEDWLLHTPFVQALLDDLQQEAHR